MAETSFAAALDETLRHEGGYVDHPLDPGGATNLGITQSTLSAIRGRPVSKAEIMALRRDAAAEIYRARYWKAVHADELPAGVDLAVFDLAVNSGTGRAIRTLQNVLGVPVDGVVGTETLAAARGRDASALVAQISAARLAFLQRLTTWPVFGRGWSRRVHAIEQRGRAMAAGLPVAQSSKPISIPNPKDKLMLTDTKSIFASRTVWANLIGLAAFGLSMAGIDTGGIDQNALVNALLGIITGGSFMASTWFRVMAKHQLK